MSYKHQKGTFKSADNVHQISYEIIIPNTKIKGIIQISHGMCEYFGRYLDFAEFMSKHGFIVCGNDHLGHGNSVNTDNELGYFSPENGWKNAVEDLYMLTKIMKENYKDIPYFLFGHSMGSFIARAYTILHGKCLTGAIFCGTSGGMFGIDKMINVIDAVKKVHGETYRSDKVYKLAFGYYNKKITNFKSEHDWISRDKAIVEKYDADKKCNFNFTLNGYENLMGVLQYVSNADWYSAYIKDLPTFIISGDMDPVGDYGKGVYKVFRKLSESNCNVSMKLYSGARHELLNETNRKEIYNDILSFFDFHASSN